MHLIIRDNSINGVAYGVHCNEIRRTKADAVVLNFHAINLQPRPAAVSINGCSSTQQQQQQQQLKPGVVWLS